jgi:hypothetical protein
MTPASNVERVSGVHATESCGRSEFAKASRFVRNRVDAAGKEAKKPSASVSASCSDMSSALYAMSNRSRPVTIEHASETVISRNSTA